MLKRDEYIITVRRFYYPLFCGLVFDGYGNKKNFEGILKTPFSLKNIVYIDTAWHYSIEDIDTAAKLFLSALKAPGHLDYVINEFKRREDNLIASSTKSIEAYFRAYEEFMPALNLVFSIDKSANLLLKEALGKKLPDDELEALMNRLNIPMMVNFHKQEEYDLVMSSDLQKHVENYAWMHSRYGQVSEYTVKDAQEKLAEINKDEFLKKWKEDKENLSKTIAYAKDLLKEESYLVDIFQYIIYYRTQRTDIMSKSSFLAASILKQEAESKKLTYDQFLRCLPEEILNNKIPSIEVLNERIKNCAVLLDEGKTRAASGSEFDQLMKFFDETIEAVSEFKGNVACKGIVKGIARIIKTNEDFSRVMDGDILVASMTTPNMVPIMKKASAFVTDEGGVTCHAAIISREMNKPCIIGTKIATKALKDGDMVEVDANTGVVKILK